MHYLLPALLSGVVLAFSGPLLAEQCGDPATAIAEVQGEKDTSPLIGKRVSVEGILTLDSRQQGGFSGFYLQQADAETDNNPLTSEALFVYTRHQAGRVGERLRVSGRVKEYHGLTELVDVGPVQRCGQGSLPQPRQINLPWNNQRPPESLENMRVTVSGSLTVIDHYNLARYGELTLAPELQIIPTQQQTPGSRAYRQAQKQQQARLILDDAAGKRHPRPVPYPPGGLGPENTVRTGDRVSKLKGVLDYRFGHWRLQPESQPAFTPQPRPESPPPRPASTSLRIVTFNLSNYFNGDGTGGGFPAERGAQNHTEFLRQHERLIAALEALDADLFVLTELENDGRGPQSALGHLTHALGQRWQGIAAERANSDAIQNAILYREDRLQPEGELAVLTTGAFAAGHRPVLRQNFRTLAQKRPLQIVAVHLKSKSCRNAVGANRDRKDGQGCFAHARQQAAEELIHWLDDTAASDNRIIGGDLNSYARETPLQQLAEAGYVNPLEQTQGVDSYTYRFRGRAGTLDYLLISEALKKRVLTAATWAINADEPRALSAGYGLVKENGAGQPWRSSDHDPVILDLQLSPVSRYQ